jgi:hypothetical protein
MHNSAHTPPDTPEPPYSSLASLVSPQMPAGMIDDSVRIVSHRHRSSSRRCLDLPPLPNNYPDFFRYFTHVPNILITAAYLFPASAGSQKVKVGGEVTYTLGESLPEPSSWLETVAGPDLSWLRALLTSVTIAQCTSYIDRG